MNQPIQTNNYKIHDLIINLEEEIRANVDEFITLKKVVDNAQIEYEKMIITITDFDLRPQMEQTHKKSQESHLLNMAEVFKQFRPVEKLVRYKYPELGSLFDRISQFILEKETNKGFLSFLAGTSVKRSYGGRPKLIKNQQLEIK